MVTKSEIDKRKELIAAEKLLTDNGLTILSRYNRMMFIAIFIAAVIIGTGSGFIAGFVIGRMG